MFKNFKHGGMFREKSLLSNDSLRTAPVIAEDKVICYVINKKEFDMILKKQKRENIY